MRRVVPAALPVLGLMAGAVPVGAADAAVHSPNLTPVANLSYAARHQSAGNQGTDIEFARLFHDDELRDFAIAGS